MSKDKNAVVRGLLYDKDGKLLKEFLAKDIKLSTRSRSVTGR